MQNNSISPGLLSQDEFNQYAADWLSLVGQPDSPTLPGVFQTEAGDRVLYVSFPISRVVELVSAVGAQQVKARFVLLPAGGQKKFSLVLFAADDTQQAEGRKSAYYLAEPSWTSAAGSQLGEAVPDSLAAVWLNNWQSAAGVAPALFATPDGPLEGYNFDLKDFVKPLFTDQPYDKQEIRLWLGLHNYYSPANLDSLTQTFGLVVRRYDPLSAVGKGDDGDLFYDLSFPCPPVH
ncbi:hypothetical protein [Hymenobacter convexus]|uniref:hypothetical protein n=1 Tax=Hymenobacter sp. CA1UV-4 TaxID=3063782 RepID=UPI00271416DF|nr:hypothetical protein [Hymenobacter sp. CA1UV-4]MDO7851683.1 hypothetical protein [Hymenobacter sp. CA1UV-4]